jgi:hypothetical protein
MTSRLFRMQMTTEYYVARSTWGCQMPRIAEHADEYRIS